MKSKIGLLVVAVLLLVFSSCMISSDLNYTTYPASIDHIVQQYGEPTVRQDTYFYDDHQVRNRIVYWDIRLLNEIERYDINGQPIYYTAIVADLFHQPYEKDVWRFMQYGWDLVREERKTSAFRWD